MPSPSTVTLLPEPSTHHKEIIGNCLICGEPSTGKHYGVVACLGCKTFFRRAVVQKQDTICRRSEPCPSTIQATRGLKLCRACRYKRCLAMGMTREALQPRRDLIGRRRLQRALSPLQPSPPSGDRSDLLELINRLTDSDEYIRRRKFSLIRSKKEAEQLYEQIASLGDKLGRKTTFKARESEKSLSIILGGDISNCTHIELLHMLEWAVGLPAFQALPPQDRILLLQKFAVYNLILEHGYYTAGQSVDDVWLITNGTCMPRNVDMLPEESKVSEDRKWRQEKLYKQMTECCIDEVATPFRRLGLSPHEIVVLKIIMLFRCGSSSGHRLGMDGCDISDDSRKIVIDFRSQVISALFAHYDHIQYENYAERFGNVLLTLSGIATAAAAMQESYQVMRLFKFVRFDLMSEQLLFNVSPLSHRSPFL